MSEKPSGIVQIRNKRGQIKDYETVAFRVVKFMTAHPDWVIQTTIVSRDEDCVVMRCVLRDETGRMRATGHAEEFRFASDINKTSALENAETSAIGRALAALGIGGTEFASANEVATAIEHQDEMTEIGKLFYTQLEIAAKCGSESLRIAWEQAAREQRRACADKLPGLKVIATAADAQHEMGRSTNSEDIDNLHDGSQNIGPE